MKNKLFTLFFALMAGTSMLFAIGNVKITIDDIDYSLYTEFKIAEVISKANNEEWNIQVANIKDYIYYEGDTYTVTTVDAYAFAKCANLHSVTIPNTVTSIREHAFAHCSNLTSVKLSSGISVINTALFAHCTNLETIVIPSNVNEIYSYAFYRCTALKSVNIPDGVTDIEPCAFDGCSSLTSIQFPNSLNRIWSSAFQSCSSLTSITIPNSVTKIERGAFCACAGLTSIHLSNSITEISENLFAGCAKLASIQLPNRVKLIAKNAFNTCSSLTTITIPDSATNIETYAFYNCSNLKSITLGNVNLNIEDEAFLKCQIEDIHFTGTLFDWCRKDWSPQKMMHKYTLYIQGKLITDITIPADIKSLKTTFANCNSLNSAVIANSVTNIGLSAFYNCSKLKSVVIGDSVNYIYHEGNVINYYAFAGCSALTSITINSDSIANKGSIHELFCSNLKEVVFGDGVTHIGTYAFHGCTKLKSVTISNSITSIGDYAFSISGGCLTCILSKALIPPTCGNGTFSGVDKSIPLYVPEESVEAYRTAYGWRDFTNILPIPVATESSILKASVTSVEASRAVVTWPVVEGADTYIIQIKSGEEIVQALSFDADGHLQSITQAPSRTPNPRRIPAVHQTEGGWEFSISNLKANTDYIYNVQAKMEEEVLYDESISFSTLDGTQESQEVPTVENLKSAGYHTSDSIVLCFYFDDAPCYDVYLVGNYRVNSKGDWITDINELKRFEALPGFSGWYVAEVSYTGEVQGKPVQLTSDGTFSWEYQGGDYNAWKHLGGEQAYIASGYEGEANVYYFNPGCYIYEIAYWKNHNNPCIINPKYNYTIQLYTPEACPDIIPAVIGSFNNWNEFIQMNESIDLQGRIFYTYTLYAEGGQYFKFADSEMGWSNELLYKDPYTGLWTTFGNSVLPQATKDTTLIFDYSDNTKYRFLLCDRYATDVNVTTLQAEGTYNTVVISWPTVDGATEYVIEIMKGAEIVCVLRFNADGLLLDNVHYALGRNDKNRLPQMATQAGTGWQYTVTNLEPSTEYTYSVTARRSDESIAYQQSIVFSTQDVAQAIGQIESSSIQGGDRGRLILRNGQVLILRGDKTYTLQGQEVK